MRELVKMTIPCYLSPLGTSLGKYKPDEIICDLSNGETAEVTFYPGVWYIETQGGGGSGGTYGDFGWGRGSGGGSGAGFKGLIRVKKTITCNISTAVAVASGKWSVKGNPTEIENMFLCDGGGAGITNEALANGGLLTVINNDAFDIIQADYLGNGNPTKVVDGSKRYGGDSVITNDGGGLPSANATSFGAGGGGYNGSGINGGAGGAGSCLIRYVAPYGINNVVFAQPNLTGAVTPGENSFAAFAESEVTTQPAWQTFNGILVTDINNWVNVAGHMPTWIAWYNPKPLKISRLRLMNCINAAFNIKDFQIQVSDTGGTNDNEWTTVYSGTNTLNTAFSQFYVDIPDSVRAYKYWRIYITSGISTSNNNRISIQDIKIYASVL